MWDLSSLPGVEPASPALQGRFLTTGPPRKSQGVEFKEKNELALRSPALRHLILYMFEVIVGNKMKIPSCL